jgi:hypothetical protein
MLPMFHVSIAFLTSSKQPTRICPEYTNQPIAFTIIIHSARGAYITLIIKQADEVILLGIDLCCISVVICIVTLRIRNVLIEKE